jgi:hypothetical protein
MEEAAFDGIIARTRPKHDEPNHVRQLQRPILEGGLSFCTCEKKGSTSRETFIPLVKLSAAPLDGVAGATDEMTSAPA